ncbi:hypothetical protein A2U01_0065348, partial [Trifolium medium]|nr:hypothetical protein [Trifolium medium]
NSFGGITHEERSGIGTGAAEANELLFERVVAP